MSTSTEIFLQALSASIIIWIWIILVLLIIRLFKNKLNKKIAYVTALTVGLLLWIVFLWFMPELIWEEHLNPKTFWIFIIVWIISFYIIETLIHNHHCKELQWEEKNKIHDHAWLMFIWTLIHNMFHWLVLLWAFSLNFNIWIITTIAILLHSIPQNVANYFLSMEKEKLVFIAALWWIIWCLVLFPFKDFLLEHEWIIISIVAWWLLYITLSDILPEWKNNQNLKEKLIYLIFVVIWILLFIWISELKMLIAD